MIKGPVKIGLTLAGIYTAAKLVFYTMGWQLEQFNLLIIINILCVVLAVFIALRETGAQNAEGSTSVLFDLKKAMQAAGTYAFAVALFLYIYYGHIDTAYVEMRYEQSMTLATEIANAPDFEPPAGMTKDDYLERVSSQARNFVSPFTTSTITLVGLLITGALYSAFMVFFQRMILPRFKR